MDYAEALESASAPLRPVQAALRAQGVTMSIEQTGGFVMVGYVYGERGPDGPHLGITVEDEEAGRYLVCTYADRDDCGTPVAEDTDGCVSMADAVSLIVAHAPR